jgi:hypothetical protein
MFQDRPRLAAVTASVILFGALLSAPGAASWKPPETLTATQIKVTCNTYYNPKGQPLNIASYTASGNASGEVTGTFTASGSWDMDSMGNIWLNGNTFTVTAKTPVPVNISGTFGSPAAGFQANCNSVKGNVTYKVKPIVVAPWIGSGPASLEINQPNANGSGTIKYQLVMQ